VVNLLNKILFCNLDLLVKSFTGYNLETSLKHRNAFLEYITILCEDHNNIVCFISREENKLNSAKKYFDEKGFTKFKYFRTCLWC